MIVLKELNEIIGEDNSNEICSILENLKSEMMNFSQDFHTLKIKQK